MIILRDDFWLYKPFNMSKLGNSDDGPMSSYELDL
jgi:hypothetical protein